MEDDPRAIGGTKGGIRKPSGKASRLIILHAGSENGWINGADLVFQSKKATGDYHDEVTSEHFEEWFHDSLMPNIPANSLIVMDNAPYHSRRLEPVPTMSSRKQMMQDWLTAREIEFPENALKRELYTLIKMSNFTPKCAVDEMAKAAGHEVVHLPPYHCELNPIELAWSMYHSLSSVCSVSLTVVSLFCITHCPQYHSQSSQSLTVVPVTHSLILCSVNSLSIMHLTAHTIWPAAVYFCMAIITICACFR